MATYKYSYTGSQQVFKARIHGKYKLECWGASGGGGEGYRYGKGGYAKGEVYLEAGDELYIHVGQAGSYFTYGGTTHGDARDLPPTYNGGGGVRNSKASFASGGGASDIRLVSSSWDNSNGLLSRIIVAGGGAGGGNWQNLSSSGGGITGTGSFPGTQTSGGSKGTGGGSNANLMTGGSFGVGGTGTGNSGGGSGGGGGWYGGGSGGGGTSESGGGSGYVFTSSSYRPSGYSPSSKYMLNNTQLVDGNSSMPNHSGSGTIIGNSSHGVVIITEPDDTEFIFTGEEQKITIPYSGLYKLEAWGAEGGSGGSRDTSVPDGRYKFYHQSGCSYNGQTHISNERNKCTQCGHTCNAPGTPNYVNATAGSIGGLGGYICGEVYLRKNDELYIYVGSKGGPANTQNKGAGWNGGGGGNIHSNGSIGYGGGGATDFRLNGTSLQDRILVAGGGGGADDYTGEKQGDSNDGSGGHGSGSSTGGEPRINGALQTGFGARNNSNYNLGIGESATASVDTGGAGGGWYGGKVTNNVNGGAGGGNGGASNKVKNISYSTGTRVGDGFARLTLKTSVMNFQFYTIEMNGKMYIPSKEFYDKDTGEFIPLESDFLYNNDGDKDGFIFNVEDIFNKINIDGEEIVPISKFLGGRIVKNTTILNKYNSNYDGAIDSICVNLNIDIDMYSKTTVQIKDSIILPREQLAFYLSTNISDKFKAAINYNGMLLGEYFKDIMYDQIRAYGIEQKNLESYDVPFKESRVFFTFLDGSTTSNDNLKHLTIKKKINESMKRLDFNDLKIKHDGTRDIINIEMLKDYKEILINKSNYIEEDKSDTLDEF